MTNSELDQFINDYGPTNQTGIDDMKVAMTVTILRNRKEKQNGNTLRNDSGNSGAL